MCTGKQNKQELPQCFVDKKDFPTPEIHISNLVERIGQEVIMKSYLVRIYQRAGFSNLWKRLKTDTWELKSLQILKGDNYIFVIFLCKYLLQLSPFCYLFIGYMNREETGSNIGVL